MNDIIDFELEEVRGNDLNFRLQNFGKVQQTNFTGQDRLKQDVVLCGRRLETVHGHHKGVPNSLIVFEWFVHTRTPRKRFKFIRIHITFESTSGDSFYDPAISKLAPMGEYSLEESVNKLELTKGWTPSVNLGLNSFANIGSGFEYKLTKATEMTDRITVNGLSTFGDLGSSYDPDRPNIAEWTLVENESTRSGIPRYFRTAVLLERRRRDMRRFTAKVSIESKVDMVTSIKNIFAKRVADDPIIFDPNIAEAAPRFDKHLHSLGSFPLEKESVFLLFRAFSNALQEDTERDIETLEEMNRG